MGGVGHVITDYYTHLYLQSGELLQQKNDSATAHLVIP